MRQVNLLSYIHKPSVISLPKQLHALAFPGEVVVNKQFGRVKYSLPRVDNHGIQWRGVSVQQ